MGNQRKTNAKQRVNVGETNGSEWKIKGRSTAKKISRKHSISAAHYPLIY